MADHPRESALELYVLGSYSLSDAEREGLIRHLNACAGCSDLVARMEEFYADLQSELEKFDDNLPILSPEELPLKVNQSIGPRRTDRPAIHEVNPRLPFRVARWIVKHPVAAAAGTLLSFGLLAWLLLLSVPGDKKEEITDFNPVEAEMRGITIIAQNKYGQALREIPANENLASRFANDKGLVWQDLNFIDIDGDGRNEMIWPDRQVGGVLSRHIVRCESFRPDREVWKHELAMDLQYPGSGVWNSALYNIQKIKAGNFDGDDVPEIYALLASNSFPGQILKFDASTGKEIGRYLHTGALLVMENFDLDGDSIQEIIAGGISNSFNDAVVVILDPREVSGQSPATGNYGLDDMASANEKAYIRIPRTIVGLADPNSNRNRTQEILVNTQNSTFRVSINDDLENPIHQPDFHITFRLDLSIEVIEVGDGYSVCADSLYAAGKIRRRADQNYLNEYTKQISWWNGGNWQHHPTWNLKNPRIAARRTNPQ